MNVQTVQFCDYEKNEYIIFDDLNTENYYQQINNNMIVPLDNITLLSKLIFREMVWGKYSSDKVCLHFGYDYNMYIVSSLPLKKTLDVINKQGLYVENIKFPYLNK